MRPKPIESSVFTYGTLMVPAVMQAVTGAEFSSCPATLDGFERFAVHDAVYPGLVETGAGRTEGMVYFDVQEIHLAVLDRFEDWLYERRLVRVERGSQGAVVAWAWIVPDRHRSALEPRDWDRAVFERDHLRDYLRNCRAFRRADRLQHPS